MIVVSANYRDRSSPYRWLVRKKGEPLDTARAFKSVTAEGVKFVESTEGEDGFGCRVVAECDTVVGFGEAPDRITLKFNSVYFINAATGKTVREAKSLVLHEDGRMEALVLAT